MQTLQRLTPRMEELPKDAHWNDWFERFGPRLLLCARQWTARASDAEDIVQEAFVRYWRHQRDVDCDPLPLILVSIRRAAFDLGRKNARRVGREEFTANGEPTKEDPPWFEADLETGGRARAIESALRDLASDQREVVVLKIWGELTFEQIGQQLSIPSNTAASRYRYGLLGLRKALILTNAHD